MRGLGFRHALSAALLVTSALGCAAQKRMKPLTALHEPKVSHPAILKAKWSKGTCSFDLQDNRLTYSSGNRTVSVELDVQVIDPSILLCTEESTAILTPADAIIALGGDKMLRGRIILGYVGDILLMKNSFYLDLVPIAEEKIIADESNLKDATLSIRTYAGNEWSVDLLNPDGWDVRRY